MTPPDLYGVLGVDRKASADEIKKKYRKLARENHPDANPDDARAEERFKEISAAYDVLGDPEKRKEYDSAGSRFADFAGAAGQRAGNFAQGDFSSFSDIFSGMFGGGGPGGMRAERGGDIEVAVELTFDQALAGTQVPISVPVTDTCPTCSGSGAKPGSKVTTCPRCDGRGIESQGQGLFSISQPCSRCGGRGELIEEPCGTCRGDGRVRTVKRYKANIPAGVRTGSRVRLAGKGEPGVHGGPAGDLYVVTRVAESPIFKRVGDNAEVEVPITVVEALRGATVEVPTLKGRKKLRIKPGTKHGTVQRLKGEGPPRLSGKSKGAHGDLHYRFVIDVPESLSKEQSEAVEKLAEAMNGANPREKLFS